MAARLPPSVPPGLVYVSDDVPGITRRRQGTGFSYRGADGAPVRATAELDRIRRLAVPPAYTAVWISPDPRGHLQATGRDARGRKQYRYHAAWRQSKDTEKFGRLLEFATALPRIRQRVAQDLGRPGGARLRRDAVIAALVRLLDTTMLRVGNEEYARCNGSYGLTTLRRHHATLQGHRLCLRFRGKSGVEREVMVEDAAVARVVRRCQALRGPALFRYADDGASTADGARTIGSADVNDYLRKASGRDITAKDFRTWHGSVHALALAIDAATPSAGDRGLPKPTLVISQVAERLGNTVAVCRKSYIHPRVLEVLHRAPGKPPTNAAGLPRRPGLTRAERRFVGFLQSSTWPGPEARDAAGRGVKRPREHASGTRAHALP